MQKIKGKLLNLSGQGFKTMKIMCPFSKEYLSARACDEAYCIASRGITKNVNDRQRITFFEVNCAYDDIMKKIDAETAEKAKERIRAAQQ